MGVVIPFPVEQQRHRPRRAGQWAAVVVLVASLTMGGVVMAGRDLLRGAYAGQEAPAAAEDVRPTR